jgi:hypothetical protein
MRADGLTVGQARQEDAKFLRSIGKDAVGKVETMDELQESFVEMVRESVMSSFDAIDPTMLKDEHLTSLFKAVDAIAISHFKKIAISHFNK